ncbi:type-IV assembly protein PilO [Herbaspirillum rubrisubalbicans M1]|uniref:type 4a pilus biogenesis protein PilO n=1 Tax=Herbaspirillum rubrisubalbicans TaxID=80842 RepID=UPI00073A0153|nr:type 4a pilus biogenesis protein PilO [Herbaspirillum rubrisubalbicans]ALU91265.1 type-IV assembly protein PilO [Herbaspirillum rubrisubalbicans M1]
MKTSPLHTHPAHWPLPARLALWLLTIVLCALSGLLLAVDELDDQRQAARQQQQDLRAQYQAALTQVAQQATLQSRQNALELQLAEHQNQLWPPDQLQAELLQAKLARRAGECGLTLESFKPLSSKLGAAIVLRGSHAGVLRFIELVSSAPLPVLFESLDISPVEHHGRAMLQMNASVSAPAASPAPAAHPTQEPRS